MPLINCEMNPILTWSENRVICFAVGVKKFNWNKYQSKSSI